MAVQNSLSKKAENTGMVEYESGGQMVKLSPKMIKSYLVSGGGNVTDQEVMMFLSLCKFQRLNPFLREAYLIKFGSSPATMVVGKDVFIKRARRNPDYVGKKAGIIVQDIETGEITEREGTFYIAAMERIVGGWAKVYIKDYETPEYAAVSFDEYAGRKANGELNNQWATKPATMIRKVALVHALREAFPEEYNGLYSAEEVPAANEIVLDDVTASEPVPVPDEMTEHSDNAAPADDVQGALFGGR
jgi:phage recombination protein Bet